jgi:hypothetical protein
LLPADPQPSAIPEPAAYGMMLPGLALLGVAARTRQTKHVEANA